MTFLLLRAGVPVRLFSSLQEAQAHLNSILPIQLESVTFSIYKLSLTAEPCLMSQHFYRKPLGVLRRSTLSDGSIRLGTSL